jgi:hypothetical protein
MQAIVVITFADGRSKVSDALPHKLCMQVVTEYHRLCGPDIIADVQVLPIGG